MTVRFTTIEARNDRRVRVAGGFTLLEVLVSMGIVIAALGGIAALLPAAGARLGEATEIDRAGTMAANARADIASRGLITNRLWVAGRSAIVFGEGLASGGTPTVNHASIGAANATELAARISSQSFVLDDAQIGGGPPGVCYGCMLSSTAAPSGAGATVRLTTVVFRRPAPEVKAFGLTQQAGLMISGSGSQAADDRRRFLPGCSWVLAVGAGEPRWIQVASSWTAYPPGVTSGPATGESRLVLSGTDWVGLMTSGSLQVFGFDGLLRVDERFVNLD